ncbi:hypothetical protein [Streptomyces sp. NPDC058451]|uniref:hypothetical protein n=1 Tax=Streptomyces sp. NPDC058451 TaxID=3346506 RepID=UPI0036638A32
MSGSIAPSLPHAAGQVARRSHAPRARLHDPARAPAPHDRPPPGRKQAHLPGGFQPPGTAPGDGRTWTHTSRERPAGLVGKTGAGHAATCPDTTEQDVDAHTELFAAALAELLG